MPSLGSAQRALRHMARRVTILESQLLDAAALLWPDEDWAVDLTSERAVDVLREQLWLEVDAIRTREVAPTVDGVEIGRRLRQVRESLGLSLRQAEDYVNDVGGDLKYTAVAIGSYERHNREISVARLVDLCERYGVTAHAIMAPTFGPQQAPAGAEAA